MPQCDRVYETYETYETYGFVQVNSATLGFVRKVRTKPPPLGGGSDVSYTGG